MTSHRQCCRSPQSFVRQSNPYDVVGVEIGCSGQFLHCCNLLVVNLL